MKTAKLNWFNAMAKVKKYHTSDVGNAKFFRDFVSGNLIFNYRTQLWYEWTGFRWQPCLNGQFQEWAKRGVAEMLKHAATLTDAKQRREYARWSFRCESGQKISEMLRLAKSETGIRDTGEDWDTEPMILACPGGVLDLKTGKFLAPNKKIKTMNCIALNPDPSAKAPIWNQFLESTYEGDADVVGFVKRLLGYSLTGSVKEQCVFCLYGQGANGKSTLTDTIMAIMGSYGYTMPFSTIEYNSRSTISNDLAAIFGKRFVIASETQEDVRLNEGRLKSLTGGDKVTARFMYKEYFTFQPTAKFVLSFNHKPVITDNSEGAWRRIHLIEHKRVFKKHERDLDLMQKLRAELPGILNWLIEGCLEWQQSGLLVPKSVVDATGEYREEMNPLRQFVEDECAVGDYHIPVTEIWEAYNNWSDHVHEKYKVSLRKFNQWLEVMGLHRKAVLIKGKVVKCWIGIALADNPKSNKGITIEVVH